MELSAERVKLGSLQLSDASLRKHGSALSAQATASEADVRAALPGGFDVSLLRSEGGQVEVQASGALFGVGASVDAVAGASDGSSSRIRWGSSSKRSSYAVLQPARVSAGRGRQRRPPPAAELPADHDRAAGVSARVAVGRPRARARR